MKLIPNAAPGIYEKVFGLLGSIGGDSGLKLLDLGCGSGVLAESVDERFDNKFSITCSDFNKREYMGTYDFRQADLNAPKLPFKDSSFDVILLIEVIEHVDNPSRLLDEIHRILKKNGTLIMSTPNVENWQSRLHFLFQSRFFSFLDCDMPKHKKPGMGHINPIFDFQLDTLTDKKFKIIDRKYNRVRIPALNHRIPTNLRILGEIKIIKLKKV